MPRAFFVEKLQNISDNNLQFQTLRHNDFNAQTLSFVEHDPENFEYNTDAEVEMFIGHRIKLNFS